MPGLHHTSAYPLRPACYHRIPAYPLRPACYQLGPSLEWLHLTPITITTAASKACHLGGCGCPDACNTLWLPGCMQHILVARMHATHFGCPDACNTLWLPG